jgi:osmoprotectant transport system ATP-binding protein
MGTRIAILRGGRIVQFDRPEAILAQPADAFVEAFVGGDRALKRLALMPVARHAIPGAAPANAPRLARNANLRQALSVLLAADRDVACVETGQGEAVITLEAIRSALNGAGR